MNIRMDTTPIDRAAKKNQSIKPWSFKQINQSESSLSYQEAFIFFDINQSESSIASQVIIVVLTNQNEVFKLFYRSEKTMFMKIPNQSFLLNFFLR